MVFPPPSRSLVHSTMKKYIVNTYNLAMIHISFSPKVSIQVEGTRVILRGLLLFKHYNCNLILFLFLGSNYMVFSKASMNLKYI